MDKTPRLLIFLDIASALAISAAAALVFFYAPLELVMGAVQKVFYFHVASGWIGMLGFLVAAVAAAIYLVRRDAKWDIVEMAAVEIGLVFTLIVIISGSIWARPTWNTWWTWDPRLTTAAIMELVYIAFLLLRQGVEEPEKRARFGAVYAIIGFISVPMTFLSIRFFRTIHPLLLTSELSGGAAFDMTPAMTTTFIASLIAFSILFVDLLWRRIRLGQFDRRLEELKTQAQEED